MKAPRKIYFVPDALFVLLLFLLLLFAVLGAILESFILIGVACLVAAYATFRVLSHDIAARRRENELFLRVVLAPVRGVKRLFSRLFPDRRHVYAACPTCGARLRLKKQSGAFTVTCPACGTRFPIHME